MGHVEGWDGKFWKTSLDTRQVTATSIPESSVLGFPLSPCTKAIHRAPAKDK